MLNNNIILLLINCIYPGSLTVAIIYVSVSVTLVPVSHVSFSLLMSHIVPAEQKLCPIYWGRGVRGPPAWILFQLVTISVERFSPAPLQVCQHNFLISVIDWEIFSDRNFVPHQNIVVIDDHYPILLHYF